MAESDTTVKCPFDRVNAIIAGLIWLFTLGFYARTVAPTVSFWDCGEFIAVSSILGVPHPPGSPLYVLLGRLFSILPTVADPAMRVNLLSSVSSAFAVMFGYLIIVRILRSWFSGPSLFNHIITYGGGISGALFAGFNLTHWNNSVEAEVYGLTMLLMFCIVWLGLVYRQHEGTSVGHRLMLLAVFLATMGVGVHMMAFLALPVVALFFMLRRSVPLWVWFVIAGFVLFELYLVFALSSRPGEVPYYIPVTMAAVFYLLYIFSFDEIPRAHFFVAIGFGLALLPLFGELLGRIMPLASMQSAFNAVGLAALAGLIMAAILLFKKYTVERHRERSAMLWLAPVGFITAAAVMVGLLYTIKGYQYFLIITAAATLILGWVIRRQVRWEVFIAIAAVSVIIIEVKPFLLAIAICAATLTLLGLTRALPAWRTAIMILAAAVVGFSINVFIPVRANQEPAINENNPQTISRTIDFLDRKQYAQVSMVERMFVRRGTWENQFGNYQRMGFWRFFHEQYGLRGPASVLLILVGLFGAWEVVRRRPRLGLVFVLLLLLTSVGLVLYMNFADGTRQIGGIDYLEVRDRDYFWTSAFMLFGLSIGLGLAFLVNAARESLAGANGTIRRALVGLSVVLFASPAVAIVNNYHYADRTGNHIPYDYGSNLLESAAPNAILFTFGDNDTFPLWCLQETYRVRTDVKVINLSLANTDWYIKQIRSSMGLELPWSDAQIEQLRPRRFEDGSYYRLQDMVVDAIIDRYFGERPIYFSVTVGSGSRTYRGQPIDDRLTMAGMLFRVEEPHGGVNIDVEESLRFLLNRFRGRGIADPSVYLDEATRRLTANYGNAFLMVADTLRKTGDLSSAEQLVEAGWKMVPHAGDLPEYLASLYEQQGRVGDLRRLADTVEYGDSNWIRTMLGRALLQTGDTAAAESTFVSVIRRSTSYRRALDELMRMQFAARDIAGMRRSLQLWLEYNPNDEQIRNALRELQPGTTMDSLTRGSAQ